jgi:hypothetical protein
MRPKPGEVIRRALAYIRQENRGQSEARNVDIQNALANWISIQDPMISVRRKHMEPYGGREKRSEIGMVFANDSSSAAA